MAGTVKLTWVDPTVGANQAPLADVVLELSADQGATFTKIATVAPGVQTFVQTNLVPGTYIFKATVVDTQTPPLSSTPVTVSAVVPQVLVAPGPVTGLTAVVS